MRERATRPFLILALAFFVLLVGSNLPTLLLCGQLSDRLGRRRVIAAGLLTAAVGLALFAAAKDTAWLFVARAVQGVSVGMVTGAATAGLVELEPHGDRRRAALYAVLVQAGGSSAGPLLAGALAQWAAGAALALLPGRARPGARRRRRHAHDSPSPRRRAGAGASSAPRYHKTSGSPSGG